MVLNNKRRSSISDDNHTERWLISYADYMTLLFAVFVVLYAFAALKNENHKILSDSLGVIFHLEGNDKQGAKGSLVMNSSDALLTSGDKLSELEQHNQGLLAEAGVSPAEGNSQLVNIDKQLLGTPFSSMKEKLQTDLLEVLEEGYAKIEQDDNWLTIEFSSGLLFDSGSATTRNSTKILLEKVIKTIAPANNYVHVRGYTDSQPINNEQFKSNWQLSSARASAIVELLQQLNVEPQRLAIEAYGQYRPKIINETAQSRATNRRVVIAISRFGWQPAPDLELVQNDNQYDIQHDKVKQAQGDIVNNASESNQVKTIKLPHGGIRITTRDEDQ